MYRFPGSVGRFWKIGERFSQLVRYFRLKRSDQIGGDEHRQDVAGRDDDVVPGGARLKLGDHLLVALVGVVGHPHAELPLEVRYGVLGDVVRPVVDVQLLFQRRQIGRAGVGVVRPRQASSRLPSTVRLSPALTPPSRNCAPANPPLSLVRIDHSAHPVPGPIIAADQREKPGKSIKEWQRSKALASQIRELAVAGNDLSHSVAQVRCQGYPMTAVAH